MKQRLSSNAIVGLSAVTFGVALAVLAVVPTIWWALPLLVVCGFGWTATVSTVISGSGSVTKRYPRPACRTWSKLRADAF